MHTGIHFTLPVSLSLSLYTCVKPIGKTPRYFPIKPLLCSGRASCFSVSVSPLLARRGRLQITALPSSLPRPAVSTAYRFLIRSCSCQPPNRPAFVVQRWDRPSSMETLPPLHVGKTQRARLYVHVLMYKQSKVLITFRTHTHTHTHTHTYTHSETHREADEISNTVRAVFVEDHLFLPVLLLSCFSVLHLCWSFLLQTIWSQPAPLPLDSCLSLPRKRHAHTHNGGKGRGGMQHRKFDMSVLPQNRCYYCLLFIFATKATLQPYHFTNVTDYLLQ